MLQQIAEYPIARRGIDTTRGDTGSATTSPWTVTSTASPAAAARTYSPRRFFRIMMSTLRTGIEADSDRGDLSGNKNFEGQEQTDSVEKLDSQSRASFVAKIDLSDRARIDDLDDGNSEGTPEKALRTECIEFFNRID